MIFNWNLYTSEPVATLSFIQGTRRRGMYGFGELLSRAGDLLILDGFVKGFCETIG